MRLSTVALCVVLAGCGGGGNPAAPGPTSQTIAGTITDTVSGAQIGTFSQTVASLPARVTVSADGYLTREARISSATPQVDLIPTRPPFDLGFFRQFARGDLEHPVQALKVLTQAPSIYIDSARLTAANVAALESTARAVIPALTGNRFQVAQWEARTAPRAPQAGWIAIDVAPGEGDCGRAELGALVGHVWLTIGPQCAAEGYAVHPKVFAHELGHALGFHHVDTPDTLMRSAGTIAPILPTEIERYHAAIAYARQSGSTDVDVDPQ